MTQKIERPVHTIDTTLLWACAAHEYHSILHWKELIHHSDDPTLWNYVRSNVFFPLCDDIFLFQFENSLRIWGAYICTVRIRYTHKKRLSSQKEDAAQKNCLTLSLAGRKSSTQHNSKEKIVFVWAECNFMLCVSLALISNCSCLFPTFSFRSQLLDLFMSALATSCALYVCMHKILHNFTRTDFQYTDNLVVVRLRKHTNIHCVFAYQAK